MEEEGSNAFGSNANRHGTAAPSAPSAVKMQPPVPEYAYGQPNMIGPPPPYTAPQEASKDPNSLAGWLSSNSLQRVQESLTANGCSTLHDLFELVQDARRCMRKLPPCRLDYVCCAIV